MLYLGIIYPRIRIPIIKMFFLNYVLAIICQQDDLIQCHKRYTNQRQPVGFVDQITISIVADIHYSSTLFLRFSARKVATSSGVKRLTLKTMS